MKQRHALFNMYFSTTISVALVLCLVGLECVLLLSARDIVRQVKEHVAVTIILTDGCEEDEIDQLESLLREAPFCRTYCLVTKEQALEEHIAGLGEDPTKFLGYNPLSDAFEVYLNEAYAQPDSIRDIVQTAGAIGCVERVVYQEDVVNILDKNIGEASMILMAVALALLVIAIVLIANTIQLQVYSKRFLINTMRLVGATPWVIRWPFIRRNLRMGFEAGCLADVALAGVYYYCKRRLGFLLFEPVWQNDCFVAGVVIVSGLLITFVASWIATQVFIRMKIDKMYEI